jgi:hypothetical protein
MMKFLRLLAAALAFSALTVHAGNAPIINHEAVPAVRASGEPASAQQILAAMQVAGAQRGWQITPAGPGKAVGVLDVRGKHTVTTDITVGKGQYAIKYKDSSNMNYNPGNNSIHPKYNTWVQTFVSDVRIQLLKP